MSIFGKIKRQNASARLIEEQLYELVGDELQNGVKRNGLWAKALAYSQGDESKAKALYISYRVQSLKDESEILDAIKEQEAKEAQQRNQAQMARDQQVREREASIKLEEAKTLLKEKGYEVRQMDFGCLIIEPLGGRKKISTADELYQYAVSRENHRKI
jgi:hypothetical protein